MNHRSIAIEFTKNSRWDANLFQPSNHHRGVKNNYRPNYFQQKLASKQFPPPPSASFHSNAFFTLLSWGRGALNVQSKCIPPYGAVKTDDKAARIGSWERRLADHGTWIPSVFITARPRSYGLLLWRQIGCFHKLGNEEFERWPVDFFPPFHSSLASPFLRSFSYPAEKWEEIFRIFPKNLAE